MAVLRTLKGASPGQIFPVEGESAVLGRHPECDIVLDAGAVSRQHARILLVNGEYFLEDLGSRNGTFLNEHPLERRERLREADQIRICDLVFVFHCGKSPEQIPPVTATTAVLVDDPRVPGGSTIMSKVNVASGPEGLRLTVNAEVKLRALVEIGQQLGKAIALREVLPKLLDSLFSIFLQADRGFVVLRAAGRGDLIPMAVKHRRPEEVETIRISRTIVNEVMAAKEAILSADAVSDARFDMAESIVDFHIRSMMCAPLIGSGGTALGVIQIDALDQRKRFTQDDLDVLASVASQVAYAVENAQLHETALRERALERELAVAHEVQQGFLPAAPPQLAGYGFFDFYEPADQLGGDYFDYLRLPNGNLAIVLADVSGKGISAALLVAKLSAEMRYCVVSEATPAAALSRLNNIFCTSRWEDRFVTMVLAVLDPERHELALANAGHMSPLLRTQSGIVEVGEAITGLPLGVDRDFPYEQEVISVHSADALVIYTDGITEAMNAKGNLYGRDRLWSLVHRTRGSVAEVGREILGDVKRFVGDRPQSDDMCLACFGRLAEAVGSAARAV